jgi:hypothetical protein
MLPAEASKENLQGVIGAVQRLARTMVGRDGIPRVLVAGGIVIAILVLLVIDRFSTDHIPLYLGLAFSGILIITGCVAWVAKSFEREELEDETGLPPRNGPDRIAEEVLLFKRQLDEAALTLVQIPFEKRNLRISLSILTVHEDVARVQLQSSYDVAAIFKDPVDFLYRAHFELSRRTSQQQPSATLRVYHNGQVATDTIRGSDFVSISSHKRDRYFQRMYRIGPGDTYRFEWECEYDIDLPYADFWSTTHTTRTFSVRVEKGPHNLEVVLQPYRDPRLGSGQPVPEGTTHLVCDGLFLPYNGVLVSISKRSAANPQVGGGVT